MARQNRAILGDWNVIDDISGFKHKASDMRMLTGLKRGLVTHRDNWNPENPQLHLKTKQDLQGVPFSRTRPPFKFTT